MEVNDQLHASASLSHEIGSVDPSTCLDAVKKRTSLVPAGNRIPMSRLSSL
jgi:hypothetical protein